MNPVRSEPSGSAQRPASSAVRAWSSEIVLPMVDLDEDGEDRARIYVVPMLPRGGRPRPIADGAMAFWSPR